MIRHDRVKFEYPPNYNVLCKHTSVYEARARKHCNSSEPIRKVYVQGRAYQKAENRRCVFGLQSTTHKEGNKHDSPHQPFDLNFQTEDTHYCYTKGKLGTSIRVIRQKWKWNSRNTHTHREKQTVNGKRLQEKAIYLTGE